MPEIPRVLGETGERQETEGGQRELEEADAPTDTAVKKRGLVQETGESPERELIWAKQDR